MELEKKIRKSFQKKYWKKSTQEGADEYSRNTNKNCLYVQFIFFNVCLHDFKIEEISLENKIEANVMCNKYLLLELFVVSMRSSLANKGKKSSYFHVYTARMSFAKLHFELHFFSRSIQ